MRGVPEGRGESSYLLSKYEEMPTFQRKVGTPSDPAVPGHLPHLANAKQGRLVFLTNRKMAVAFRNSHFSYNSKNSFHIRICSPVW